MISEWLGVKPAEGHDLLVETLFRCHARAALQNDNVSSAALRLSGAVANSFAASAAAACATLGGPLHGPTDQARVVIYEWIDLDVSDALLAGRKVAGWGNHFYTGEIDPAWKDMEALVRESYPDHAFRLDRVTGWLAAQGKNLHPNAAAYTAVTAQVLGLPHGVEVLLAIAARLPVWALQWLEVRL